MNTDHDPLTAEQLSNLRHFLHYGYCTEKPTGDWTERLLATVDHLQAQLDHWAPNPWDDVATYTLPQSGPPRHG